MTPDEILQAEKEADQWAYDEIVSLRKQRDELLAALEGMEKWASSIHDGYQPSTASIAAAPYREAARAAIAKATGDDDAALECTCAAKDIMFGRCCKVTPNAAVQPRTEGTSRCNSSLGGNAKEKT